MFTASEPFLTDALIYKPFGFELRNAIPDKESAEYNACTFELNGLKVVFRSAKITPKKTGQFVTLWKRLGSGPIMPFDATDAVDLVVISVRFENHYGQFVFPKSIMLKRGVFTTACKDGKRAMRVYPSWDVAENAQAKRTQKWQLKYFIDFSKSIDEEKIRCLYSL